MLVVVDTSVLVSAMLGPGGASREVMRRALTGRCVPLIGIALLSEYEAVMSRDELFASCVLDPRERERLLDAFLGACRWTRIYYGWRPNVPDESDNHIVELAVAGGAAAIVTKNIRDFAGMELRFAGLRIVTPAAFVKE